ncbi:hypothetical protein K438DRAFT_1775429 [Mycena galopus ATCC 62051]|nr:hypothetical protein K438DRAFT_1775429 [Mycena galopus ATCC 62051]
MPSMAHAGLLGLVRPSEHGETRPRVRRPRNTHEVSSGGERWGTNERDGCRGRVGGGVCPGGRGRARAGRAEGEGMLGQPVAALWWPKTSTGGGAHVTSTPE